MFLHFHRSFFWYDSNSKCVNLSSVNFLLLIWKVQSAETSKGEKNNLKHMIKIFVTVVMSRVVTEARTTVANSKVETE